MNGVSHFLDLSHLYGKSEEKQDELRDGAFLKTFSEFGRQLPPLTDRPECLYTKEQGACFDSGMLSFAFTVFLVLASRCTHRQQTLYLTCVILVTSS